MTEFPIVLNWQFDPVLIGSLVTAAVCYFLAIGPLRERIAPGQVFPSGRAAVFAAAIILTYLVEGSPLHDLSERYLFSAHMFQHLAITYFCAPLFIWGLPTWLLRPLLLNPVMRPVAKLFSNPVVAAFSFALFLSLWHIPAIYDAGLRNSSLHHSQHIIFMLISFIYWWPVMSRLPELPALGYGTQILYLFATSTVLQLPLFGLVTFSSEPFYSTYINAPRIWFESALSDQQMAGVVMKVLALIFYSPPIIVIFARWYRDSQRRGYVRPA